MPPSELEIYFAGIDEDRPPRRRSLLERLCEMLCGVSLPVRVQVDFSPPGCEEPCGQGDEAPPSP